LLALSSPVFPPFHLCCVQCHCSTSAWITGQSLPSCLEWQVFRGEVGGCQLHCCDLLTQTTFYLLFPSAAVGGASRREGRGQQGFRTFYKLKPFGRVGLRNRSTWS
jgi:hypothetical protein